jgi:hypothetical protein
MPQVLDRPAGTTPPAVAEASNSLVLHFLTLRKAIGFIGIALPWTLIAGENLRDWLAPSATPMGRAWIELSISAYFHTGMRDVFVGSLCAVGVFLLCYKGYERTDSTLAKAAGAFALLVALCPTSETSREATDVGGRVLDSVTFFSGADSPDPALVGYVHFGAAAAFFLILAYMSIFLFTRTDAARPTPRKLQRNTIYRVCGIVMLACIIAIGVAKLALNDQAEARSHFVFWLEAIAVVSFGISWLTKGEAIRPDRP